MLDIVSCPGKLVAAPICVAWFHAPSEDSVGAVAVIKRVDGMLMAVMALFQKLSASVPALARQLFVARPS